MLKNKVRVQSVNPYMFIDNQTIILSERMMRRFRMPENRSVQLELGSVKQQVSVVPIRHPSLLRISEELAKQLGVKNGTVLSIRYKPDSGRLILGPLIGVLVARARTGTPDKMFGSNTVFCKELTEACKQQGASVFVFTPSDIPAKSDRITGWRYENGWKRGEFPIPQVVHNRLTTRRLENKNSVQQFFKEVKSMHGASVFNEKYLDKSEVFQALRQVPELRSLLPESHVFKGIQSLRSMCGKYDCVFLKPIRGSLGKGIIRIIKQGGGYISEQTYINGVQRQSFAGLQSLYASIAGKTKSQSYQIQQGLWLISADRHPLDFRALVQKNRTGNWAITSVVARIAGDNHFVSNLARGGTLSSVSQALARCALPPAKRKALPVKLKKAALLIAKGIEDQIPCHFGELGVDLAIDRNGRVWLLEVNSKPSKTDTTSLQETKIRPSIRQIVQYSRYLAEL